MTAPSFDLAGKVTVVTGGSRGLGRAIAEGFASRGADVVIASRKLESCQQAAQQISAATGRTVEPIACHVGRWDDCDALIDATIARFGRIDVLVNNAGMSPLYDTLTDVTEELYDKTLSVNLKGPFRLAVRAASHMAQSNGGSIINVGTIGSLLASPNELPYACAKAGLNALTVGLAEAFAPTVRVNGILPGPFATDVTREWTDEMKAGHYVPLGRIGQPSEIVGAALYLASSAASFTTGALIRVDGGVAGRLIG